MENPGFQDSDQSMYESALGTRRPVVMPHPRSLQHLATLHHPHSRNTVISQAQAPVFYGNTVTNGANTIGHTHIANHHGIPATAHIHGGRVVGVTGVPHSEHAAVGGSNLGLANTFTVSSAQPLYSCQAPRGHEHVYQCPGHRGEPTEHYHNSNEFRNHPVEYSLDLRDASHLHKFEHRCDNHNDSKQVYLDNSNQPVPETRDRQGGTGPDQRTEYHYGGSDYSSTEPIYAQPHLQPHEDQSSPTRTPTLTYTTMRSSVRNSSSTLHHGTPARFLVRTDSTGASTSSTLPTVSALMAMDPSHSRTRTHTHGFRKVASLASTSSASTKLKGIGFWGSMRAKYFEGTKGSKKAALLLGLLILLLILVLGGLAAVLYLTLGGGFGAMVGQAPQLVHLTEEGSCIVTGQFRITNQNYWHGLDDENSESFRILSRSIEKEIDSLFLSSVWSREYNRSEIIGLSDGSLTVRARLYLNSPDTSAAKKLGSAFLRGLQKRHGQEWLGQYTVDITSIRFAEILVDSTAPEISPTPLTTTVTYARTGQPSKGPGPNVGWGEWGPWSSCNPCSPQYDQIRTRKCRLDDGKGLLVSNIELCSPEVRVGHLQSSQGNMESRPCQCQNADPDAKGADERRLEEDYFSQLEQEVELTTFSTSVESPLGRGEESATSFDFKSGHQRSEIDLKTNICNSCSPSEVCVALFGESLPSCRPERNSNDRTGCGGLCSAEEVCQAVGPRAFVCHSASQCLDDEWRCDDGLCIPQAKRCDGHHNCYDRSDEVMCSCGRDEFHCGSRTSCLPLTVKCDGKVDCWDGFDEANCTKADIALNKNSELGQRIDLLNSRIVPNNPNSPITSAGSGDGLVLPPSVPGSKRVVGTAVVNRTAIGLSSLSNRERELLS